MSLITEPTGPPADPILVPAVSLWPLSVEQYHEMIRTGILREGDPVELLDGLLARKMGKNPPHGLATELLRDAFPQKIPPGWCVVSQNPVTLATSEPEPDAAIVRGHRRQYGDRHPGPAEVGVVIEVADTTLEHDRTVKKAIYGRAGIAVYWILDLIDRRLEVYTDPTGPAEQPGYASRRDYGPDEEAPLMLDGREVARIAVGSLLP